jgi:ATP-dependent Clp protease ATP-binding subunit ClpA
VIDALAIRLRQRLAARRPGKPIAVMCFAGAPGVGKSHLAKILAQKLYNDGRHLHFFDMTKYQQSHFATTLFGVPAGHVGSQEPGLVSRALRDVPNAIVLLDEFEKAHRDIHTQFLTAWNDGFVTDLSNGVRYSTAEAIFILTTNAGWPRISEQARAPGVTQDDLNASARGALLDAQFVPEVLSRIDDVFAFRELAGLDVARVVALEMEARAKEYTLEIVEHGVDPEILVDAMQQYTQRKPKGGVREIAREIEQRLADGLIEAKSNGAAKVRLQADGRRIKVIVVPDEVAAEQQAEPRQHANAS